ncbi:MAG: hypothetical protein HYR94_20240 [Chloroflexi bacterium]|nr:hypothetical protein [Chloroflexota bacterium]
MNNQPENHPSSQDQINIDEIMATIRRTNQQRQAAIPRRATYFMEFGEVTCPEEPADGQADPLFYFLLRELNQPFTPRFYLERRLTPSPLDKLPLLGPLWNALRRQLHNLSFYYANQIAGQMIGYNRYLVTILNLLTRYGQQRDDEIKQLRQRLAQLEAQLAYAEPKK